VVVDTPATHTPAAQPTARDFVRLKLRLTGNGMRGHGWRVALFVAGSVLGFFGALAGFVLFFASGATRGPASLVTAGFGGAGLTLGWLLLPLLYFGVDETIDPARFALLPISRRTMLRGMLAAALVSVPSAATAVALLGLVTGAALGGGLPVAALALAAAVLAILLCVVGSRALTSAFASMLRSRRVRDLAAILIAVLASSIAPLQLGVSELVAHSDAGRAVAVARVLGWTPLAAAYTAPVDAADGRWADALAKLGIAAVTVVALALWWSATLESAMIGVVSGGRTVSRAGFRTGVVTSLLPALLRPLRPGRFTALMAREWRYWWRDPRRRASILSLTIAGVVLPVALRAGGSSGGGRTPLPLAVALSAVLAAMVLANQFGTDGSAYALHLLIGVPGRVELRARAIALALIMAPLLLLATVTVGLLTGAPGAELPAAIGTVAAGLGVSTGVSALISVLTPYAFPDSTNPFSVSGGTGGMRGLLAAVGSFGALILQVPMLLFALLTHGLAAGLAVLAAGVAYGVTGLVLGTYIAGDILDRRGPEILVAVTPRR
jgi:ABC-2 type transport system permease protein